MVLRIKVFGYCSLKKILWWLILLIILTTCLCTIFRVTKRIGKFNYTYTAPLEIRGPQTSNLVTKLNLDVLLHNISLVEVYSSGCRIPQLVPFEPEVVAASFKPRVINCTTKYPILFTSTIFSKLVQEDDAHQHGYHSCSYRKIPEYGFQWLNHQKLDNLIGNLTDWILIKNKTTTLPPDHEFVIIRCTNSSTGEPEITDFLSFPHLRKRRDQLATLPTDQPATTMSYRNNTPNVVILGLDSVSHMQLQRIIPKFYSFLKNNLSAIGMQGYNKVGANTQPNLMAILLGMTVAEVTETCSPTSDLFYDTCPFIWKKFKAFNYSTSYAEDSPRIGTFEYRKKGFKTPPVDHYFRPLAVLLDHFVGHEPRTQNLCWGPRSTFKILTNYMQQVVTATEANNKNYFQFIWQSTFFHDHPYYGRNSEADLLDLLKWFRNSGRLENTIFIVMSDHGSRYGSIRNTPQGRVEESMPFLYFKLPSWFKKRYPIAVSNLEQNFDKLTTPFDLHETLNDLTQLSEIENSKIYSRSFLSNSESVKRGRSLFLPISSDRSCFDAGIPSEFCVCSPGAPVLANNSELRKAADIGINTINSYVAGYENCSVLALKRIVSASVVNIAQEDSSKPKNRLELSLVIVTTPGDSIFEFTIRQQTEEHWNVTASFRTDVYTKKDSACVEDGKLKSYCVCIS